MQARGSKGSKHTRHRHFWPSKQYCKPLLPHQHTCSPASSFSSLACCFCSRSISLAAGGGGGGERQRGGLLWAVGEASVGLVVVHQTKHCSFPCFNLFLIHSVLKHLKTVKRFHLQHAAAMHTASVPFPIRVPQPVLNRGPRTSAARSSPSSKRPVTDLHSLAHHPNQHTCVEQAGHGQEDLHALSHNQLNLALLPAQRRAPLLAHKRDLGSMEVKRGGCVLGSY